MKSMVYIIIEYIINEFQTINIREKKTQCSNTPRNPCIKKSTMASTREGTRRNTGIF